MGTLEHNHRLLFGSVAIMFIVLTIGVAIIPALDNERTSSMLPAARPMTERERAGERVYISEGCVACHTQQVRSVEMDKVWGDRPGIPSDYAQAVRQNVWTNAATLMGTQRTGPDLTSIGKRQPSMEWHLLHLYDPRATVPSSIMPGYPWLFERKARAEASDVVVAIPGHRTTSGVIVARTEALDLVAYLQSRRQDDLPTGMAAPAYRMTDGRTVSSAKQEIREDGAALYTTYCGSCHQPDGKGLEGAFPPLAGSPVVTGNDIDLFVSIVMDGYDRRPEYAIMPAVGEMNALKIEQIVAIMNHERSSWGNKAAKVDIDQVRTALKKRNRPQP